MDAIIRSPSVSCCIRYSSSMPRTLLHMHMTRNSRITAIIFKMCMVASYNYEGIVTCEG